MTKDPSILTHPNIPKPLHGVNPRTVMGQKWWDVKRKEAYASTAFRCLACDIQKRRAKYHKWLEAHEYYDYDYLTGTLTLQRVIPLCHSCHNFIHSGRLYAMYEKGEVPFQKITDILEHGLGILSENGLKAFFGTIEVAELLGIKTDVEPEIPEPCEVKWHEWKMVIEGKEYFSNFKDEEEWANFYGQ
jgi:hypothetical protein